MTERTTRHQMEAAFVRVMKAIGGDYNSENLYSYSDPNSSPAWEPIPGRFALDNAPIYGGVCIVRCTPPYRNGEGCGEKQITKRMKFGEFCEAARFMTEMLWSVQTKEDREETEVSLNCPNCGVAGPIELFTPAE
jgi:hypothetical protein